MIRLLIGLIAGFLCLHTTAQDIVILKSDIKYEIVSVENSIYTYQATSLINNAIGRQKALPIIPKDSYHKLKSVQGRILDNSGKVIERFNKDDFVDYSANSSVTFKDDQRLLVYWIESQSYPYTLELEYTVVQKESLYHTSWTPQVSEGIAVLESSFTIENPLRLKLNYYVNDYGNSIKTLNSTPELRRWRVDSLDVYTSNKLSRDWWHYSPGIIFALEEFKISGTVGSFASWEEFGSWYHELNRPALDLRADMVPLEEIVGAANNRLDSIRLAYQWVQKQTRYSSIQLGIGGWKSLPASEVLDKGYGDCKALSTITMNILDLLGIESYYALVKAGRGRDIISEFPASQFNHVILAVPNRKDTIWLECTSQIIPFGQLGSFTNGKTCLIVKEEDSYLKRASNQSEVPSEYSRELHFAINDSSANHIVIIETLKSEMMEADNLEYILWQDREAQDRWLQNRYAKFGDCKNHELLRVDPYTILAKYELTNDNAIRRTGNFYVLSRPDLKVLEMFEQDRFGSSSSFKIPETLTLREKIIIEGELLMIRGSMFKQLDSNFGNITYDSSQNKNGTEINIVATIYSGDYTISDYEEFQSFLSKIRNSIQGKLVMNPKT